MAAWRTAVVLAVAVAVAAGGPARAQEAAPGPRELRVIGRIGIDAGGSRLAKVTMTDGSTQTLHAGGLFTIAAGLVWAPVAAPVVLEATYGYKVDDVTASNGQLKFDRWPLELLASYRVERHRMGLGVTRHGSPTYKEAVDGSPTLRVKMDDATGLIVQYAYAEHHGRAYWDAGLRLTFIEYRAPGATYSGNSVGGFVSLGF